MEGEKWEWLDQFWKALFLCDVEIFKFMVLILVEYYEEGKVYLGKRILESLLVEIKPYNWGTAGARNGRRKVEGV